MKKEFLPYKLAFEFKELGFDEECLGWYVSEEHGVEIGLVIKEDLINSTILAPTYHQAFNWFFEKSYRFSFVFSADKNSYWFDIWRNNQFYFESEEIYPNYNDVKKACLEKLIEIVKDGNKTK